LRREWYAKAGAKPSEILLDNAICMAYLAASRQSQPKLRSLGWENFQASGRDQADDKN
jgi:hypothetical protein